MIEDRIIRTFYDEAGGETGSEEGGDDKTNETPAFDMSKWREHLPEDIREHESLAKFSGENPIGDMARSLIGAQKLIGKDPSKTIELPAVDDEEGRRALLTHLGLPEDVSGYEFQPIEKAPDWLDPKESLGTGFAEVAHKVGILPQQAQAVFSWFGQAMMETQGKLDEDKAVEADKNIQGLEKEWGEAFKQNTAAAEFAVEKLGEAAGGEGGGKALRDLLNAADIGHEPLVIKALAHVGKLLAEDTSENTDNPNPNPNFTSALTPEEAKSKGRELLRAAQQIMHKDRGEANRLNKEANRFFEMAVQAGK